MDTLDAISPVDGRYRKYAEPLAKFFSEAALMKYRVLVEIEYLIAISEHSGIDLRDLTEEEKKLLRGIARPSAETEETETKKTNILQNVGMSFDGANIIREIERKGYKDIPATNHDVKAIEYFLRDRLENTSLKDCAGWIHFALTSEDVNNLAYGLMLCDAVARVLLPRLEEIRNALGGLAKEYRNLPMLARTHGQPASPTTFGKEFKVFEARLGRQIEQLRGFRILAKLNGATGNYNAHVAAYPNVDWVEFTKNFIAQLNGDRRIKLEANLVTTQIEPHDSYAELFDTFRRINTILIGFGQDIWRYISDGWIAQKAVAGEVGSSTMPHKVNPIKFENSEGNLGVANALFSHFSSKLPISRLQRDLSDSTVERNFGAAFGHSLIGYGNLLEGLERVRVNGEKVKAELNRHPEVIAEAIQTILRREGVAMPYEKLKELTRGNEVTMELIRKFIDSLDVKPEVKEELKKITPENYVGLASKLAGEI